jgi:beta-lactamase class A
MVLLAAAVAITAITASAATAAHAGTAAPSTAVALTPATDLQRRAASLALPPANPFATAAMHRFLASRSGNITAAVYDVKSNTTYLYHPDDREQTASIIKVDILATLLAQAQSRGTFIDASQRAIATGMIEESDNDDATDLWQEEGGPSAVAEFNARLHMTQTTPNFAWGLTTTTPRDQLLLLRHVALPNDILRYPSRSYETYLMRHVIGPDYWGVTAGPRPGVSVAVKNGWLPVAAGWQVNSIGAIKGDGRDYLLAVMTNHEDEEGYGIDTIEGISSIVWSTFATRPATGPTASTGPTATSGTARRNR